MERISILNIEVERKSKLLRSMTAKDDAEKWEDELFETRLKELRSARAVINTQSSVTREDVLHQIKDLNSIIVQTAEIAVETPLQTQGLVVQLEDMKYLGKILSLIFQQAGNRLNDQGFIRATLQIFLTESCMKLIDSWHLENKNLDMALRDLYSHIHGKGEFFCNNYIEPFANFDAEEQTVAGKWRQITFGQQPQGTSDNFLSQYSDKKAQQLMQISAAAGWGGDVSKVRPLVRTMMMKAENIRINVKARIISADLQPWIATYCERYDAQSMQDDGLNVGLKRVGDAKNCHVLGSTELGLRIEGTSDNESGEFRGLQSRPRVLLLESLGFRMQSSTGRH